MIEAENKRWARLIFNPYIDYLLKKNFGHFYLLNEFPRIDKLAGLIIAPNHFSWWDGFISDYLSRNLIKRKIHVMMLEDQLKRYWFFKKVGAYSINPANPVSMARTIKYSRKIAASPDNLVVLFPQGEIQSLNEKSVSIKEGLKLLLETDIPDIYILPLAVKVEYGENKNPDIIAKFGKLIEAREIKTDFELFTEEFLNNIENLKITVVFDGCRDIFR